LLTLAPSLLHLLTPSPLYYDPIKRSLGNVFNRTPWLRRLFYNLLDLLLLRTWHVHRELRQWARGRTREPLNILDAGAGYGQYTYWLSSLSSLWHILTVDVKEEQVADSNNFFRTLGRPQVQFAVQDLVLYQEPNSFDLATTPAVTFTADGKACAHRFFLRVESAAGTKQPLAPSFETYPNPAEASHKLQFSAHGLRAGTATATLLTTYGTEVLSQPVTVGGNGLLLGELSLAGVKPGIYLLRFTAGNTVVTKRLEVR
jgi:SAM-dependent methyltransferase